MGEKTDRAFRETFYSSKNDNTIRNRRHYGKPFFLSTNSDGNYLGRSVPIMGTLCNEDGFRGGDELSRQVELPCQNANHINRQNQNDGIGSVKPSNNSEFDDFGGRGKDHTNHVRGVGSQWRTIIKDIQSQPEYSDRESKNNTDNQMVRDECSKRIQSLSKQLGPLLRVNTPESNARAEKKPCHLVLPNDKPKIWSSENDTSVCQVFPSDEIDEEHEYRNNLPILIDTFMDSNRCFIANSLGYEIHDKDQKDYISYINEKLNGYTEEVIDYGFEHIIIIGELNCGLLFLDCFGRVFNLDSLTSALLFHGDYFKGVERVTKGLELDWATWIADSDEGNIVEVDDGPTRYLIPFEKKQIKEIHMKEKKKKSSRKKRSSKKHP